MGVQKLSNFCCFIFVFTIFPSFSLGWSQEELSLFDLVDEFRGNFYEFLEVPKTAADAEIRKAYRKLSLKLHPDRNPDPQADVHFRQLTAIYDVLKDEALRKRYDEILEFGLPDWRQPVFYYRHLRRMPWWEFVFILIFILTGGHYLVLWAAYWEKKFEFEELFGSKMRRKEKKLQRKFKVDVDEIIQKSMDSQIPKPSWRQLLPIILIRTLKNSIFGLPQFFIDTVQNYRDLREEKRLKLEAAQIAVEAELAVVPKVKKRIRLEDLDLPSAEDSADLRPVFNQIELESNQTVEEIITGDWTAQEVSELIRFSQKFPTGTPDRWEKISRLLRRKAQDVTDMVGQLKHLDPKEYQKLANYCQTDQQPFGLTAPKTAPSASSEAESTEWSASQQKCLEQALIQFGKGVPERWESIARCVPGKTKEDCIGRYKQLVELVKQKKAKAA